MYLPKSLTITTRDEREQQIISRAIDSNGPVVKDVL